MAGQWKDLDYALARAREIIEKEGVDVLPSKDKLKKLGCGGLVDAIFRHHKGFPAFRKKLGERHLRDLDYALEQAREVMEKEEVDVLPSPDKLKEMGYGSLVNSIYQYHSGFKEFRKRLGEELQDWKDPDYTLKKAREVMEREGVDVLPNGPQLRKLGRSDLLNAIHIYQGGIPAFRKLLGEKDLKNIDYALEKAREVVDEHKLDALPGSVKLGEMGYASLATVISKNHGGFPAFREKLGEEIVDWKNFDYALGQARKLMEEHNFENLPTREKMGELGYSSLGAAISRYHGGFHAFRGFIDEGRGVQSRREQLENLFDEYLDDGGAA